MYTNNLTQGISKGETQRFLLSALSGVVLVFLAAVWDVSGQWSFFAYLAGLVLVLAFTGKLSNLALFTVLVLMNTTLANGAFGNVATRRVMLCVTILLLPLSLGRRSLGKPRIPGWYFLIWFAYLFVDDVLLHGVEIVKPLTYGLCFLVAYLMQAFANQSKKQAQRLLLSVFVGMAFITAIAYLELLLGRTFFYSQWTGNERYRYGIMRVGSTVADPNFICLILVPLLFLLETRAFKGLIHKYVRVGFEIAALILVVLTSSRTGLISLFLGVAVCLFLHRKYLLGVGVSLLAALSGVIPLVLEKILAQFPASTGLRNYVVEAALTAWRGSPVLGTGLGTVYYPAGDMQYDTMNTYVNMLLRYGVLGLAFYLAFFVVLMLPDIRAWFRAKTPDRDLILRTGCVAAFLVMIYSLDTFGIVLMWSLPGLFTAMRTLQLSQETLPQT